MTSGVMMSSVLGVTASGHRVYPLLVQFYDSKQEECEYLVCLDKL